MSQAGIAKLTSRVLPPEVPTEFVCDTGSAVPVAHILNLLGDYQAAGTEPVHTEGSGNTVTAFVQVSQAIAAPDITKIGICNFDSSAFSVDGNGFVTLAGGGAGIEEVNLDTGTSPITPTAGAITLTAGTVTAGTNPIRTNGTASDTAKIEVQFSQHSGSSNANLVGLSSFDQSSFSVDINGYVTMAGGGGFNWLDVSGAYNAVKNTGYFVTATATATLPPAPSQGDTIKFFVDTTDILTIQASGTQIIRLGNTVSSAGGTCVSTDQGDSLELTYRSSDTCWCTIAGANGNWTLA